LIAVIEMGLTSWLVAGIVPGIERHPLKKLAVDEEALLASFADGRPKRPMPAVPSRG
jgi:transposase